MSPECTQDSRNAGRTRDRDLHAGFKLVGPSERFQHEPTLGARDADTARFHVRAYLDDDARGVKERDINGEQDSHRVNRRARGNQQTPAGGQRGTKLEPDKPAPKRGRKLELLEQDIVGFTVEQLIHDDPIALTLEVIHTDKRLGHLEKLDKGWTKRPDKESGQKADDQWEQAFDGK